MIERIDKLNALEEQISALLELMMMTDTSVDIKAIKVAAEMTTTMFDEFTREVAYMVEAATELENKLEQVFN